MREKVTTRYRAGRATYRGDARPMVGELRGPTTYGAMVIATGADYADGRTVVQFAYAAPEDLAAAGITR